MKNTFLLFLLTFSLTAHSIDESNPEETVGPCPYAKIEESNDIISASVSEVVETTDTVNATLTMNGPEVQATPEETKRVELFRFEKDYNPKNVLHYGIKVNTPSCTIAKKENGAPNFSNYWIMGEEKGQTKNMTSKDLERLGPIVLSQDAHQVKFKMNAMKDIKIKKKEIVIEAKIVDGSCKTVAYVELDDGQKITLEKFYAVISTFVGIPTGVDSLRVDGRNQNTNAPITLKF